MPYEPQEDSFLLRTFVRKYAHGRVLDMGTGSGIQAVEAAHSKKTKTIFAVDIDPNAIAYCKEHNNKKRHKKITWLLSDLFSAFKAKKYKHFFDTIIFNAPYLPQDHRERDIALEGGKQGHETIERFLNNANKFLKPNGIILLVFSSLTPHMPRIIEENLFIGKELGKRHVFFEDMFVYLLTKNPILNELEKERVCDVSFFARGKRGLVFTGSFGAKKVAIKIKREESKAVNAIVREANTLKEINKHGIGPAYLFSTPRFLVYEFAHGEYLKDIIGSKKIKSVCKKILQQCFQLDLLHVDKQEMTRPMKHAIVKDRKVTLIDWERARKVEQAHNVTQFCQFMRNHITLNERALLHAAKAYTQEQSKERFKNILKLL